MFDPLFQRSGLSLDRLKTLIEVAAAGSIAGAAGADPVRQSQYSRQLKELEQYFAVELTRRKGRTLALTPAGQRLASLSSDFFAHLSSLAGEISATPVTYTIGAGDVVIQWVLTSLLGNLTAKRPAVRFRCANLRTAEIVKGIGDGAIDFGIVRKSALRAGLESRKVGVLKYCLYVAKTLVDQSAVQSAEKFLVNLPVVSLDAKGAYVDALTAMTAKLKRPPNVRLECTSLPQVCRAIRSGRYVGVLPCLAREELPAAQFLEIAGPGLARFQRPLYLCWRKRLSSVRSDAERLAAELGAELVAALKRQTQP